MADTPATPSTAASGAMTDDELMKLLQQISQTSNADSAAFNAQTQIPGMNSVAGNPALIGTITPEEQQLQQKLNMENNIAGLGGIGGSVLGGVAGGLIGGIPTGGAGALPGIGIGTSVGGLLGGVGGKFLQDMLTSGDRARLQQLEQQRQQKALNDMQTKQQNLIDAQNRTGLLQAFFAKYL